MDGNQPAQKHAKMLIDYVSDIDHRLGIAFATFLLLLLGRNIQT